METNPKEPGAQYQDVDDFIKKCISLAGKIFRSKSNIYINRSPGRLDLMGGNDDYTGGLVFETTIKEATLFAAQPREDNLFILHNPSIKELGWEETLEFSLEDIVEGNTPKSIESLREWINTDPKKSWIAYIVGNLYYLKIHFPEKIITGLNMFMDSNIPLGKGVSSSAALEVSAMKACAAAYGIEAKGVELALWTQWVENAIAQSASGVMDQFAVIMGNENSFTPMLCQPCIPFPLVHLPEGLRIWGVDSGVRHSVAGIEYEAARAGAFMGYQLICEFEGLPVSRDESGVLFRYSDPLWDGYLARVSPSRFRENYEERLPKNITGSDFLKDHPVHFDPYTPIRPTVDYALRNCTRYAVEENNRVNIFFELLGSTSTPVSDRTLSLLGELMFGAHVGYSDCGLGSRETDLIVNLVKAQFGNDLYGAKITGGGAGGTVAILGRDTEIAEKALKDVINSYNQEIGIDPYVFKGSSQGADAFGIIVITI